MEPPSKKARKLLDDDSSSDSGDESGGVAIGNVGNDFKVNEEYARRFEHNKKREELQKCMYITTICCFNADLHSGSKTRQRFQLGKTSQP